MIKLYQETNFNLKNGNRWNGSNPNVQIFLNGLSANNTKEFLQHVFAEQGFTISAGAGAGSRSGDKFYRTREVATYYEVTQTSAGELVVFLTSK
jgi:hypothetical protein